MHEQAHIASYILYPIMNQELSDAIKKNVFFCKKKLGFQKKKKKKKKS